MSYIVVSGWLHLCLVFVTLVIVYIPVWICRCWCGFFFLYLYDESKPCLELVLVHIYMFIEEVFSLDSKTARGRSFYTWVQDREKSWCMSSLYLEWWCWRLERERDTKRGSSPPPGFSDLGLPTSAVSTCASQCLIFKHSFAQKYDRFACAWEISFSNEKERRTNSAVKGK